MKFIIALLSLASTSAFTMQGHTTLTFSKSSVKNNGLRMSAVDDEVAALRAAAQKAREDAQKLAKVSYVSMKHLIMSLLCKNLITFLPYLALCSISERNSEKKKWLQMNATQKRKK